MDLWIWGIPIIFFVAFLVMYRVNRASLLPSFLLTLSLFSTVGTLALNLYHSESAASEWLLAGMLTVFWTVTVVGVYALIAFLLFDEGAVLRREKRTLANMLPLILAVALTLYIVVIRIIDSVEIPWFFRMLEFWIQGMGIYYAIHAAHFIIAAVLCNLTRPRGKLDYIIVLGAGLSKGAVTPLLAGRVNKAIAFYNKQKALAVPPKIIMSGGKGVDEPRSEAEAMAEYAKRNGVPAKHILIEPESTSTFENMLFSKQIMDGDAKGRRYSAVYATSGYHVLRAGIYARKAGLKISGIGSKTAFYFLPGALIREYIAYIAMHKKQNILFAVLGLLFTFGTSVLLMAVS